MRIAAKWTAEPGVHFAVWAPNAEQVSVIGDFNGWNPASHPMRSLGVSGIWEAFVPDVGDGERYKYEILSRAGGVRLQKADPYGVFFESDASGAAIVWDLDRYTWRDSEWMKERPGRNGWLDRPLSVYEVHLGSWKRVPERGSGPLTYREMAAADRSVRQGHGVHAYRAAAGAGAPVRRDRGDIRSPGFLRRRAASALRRISRRSSMNAT